ncbi:MAG: hypothetical protein FVQ77_16735 [Cytophagales bacterium]|nr:hypothetical protein [Cytophagales bacterium]
MNEPKSISSISKSDREDIRKYIHHFENLSAEEILVLMEEWRDFFYENMTNQGKKFFEYQRKLSKKRVL